MKDTPKEPKPEEPPKAGADATQKIDFVQLLRSEWLMLVIAVFAALVVSSIPLIRKHIIKVQEAASYAKQHKSAWALAEGLRLAAVEDTRDKAFASLQHALDAALTKDARHDALLAIGEFLLVSARKSPKEFALAARQYFRITLAHEKRPDRRLRALDGLFALARLQEDLGEMRSLMAEINEEKMADDERMAHLAAQLDGMLALGQWHDIYGVLQKIMPYEADRRFSDEVGLRWATVHEQVMNRKDYLALWRKTLPADGGSATDEQLLKGLYTNLLLRLDPIGKGASGRASAEAKFRAFRLVFKDGRYEEAGLRLENMRLNDLVDDQAREAALLTIALARHENHMRVFQERVLRYVEIYAVDADIEAYFNETLNLRISSGKGKDVLNLLEQKLSMTSDAKQRARLLLFIGGLARRLQSDAVAERCYDEILNIPKAAEYHAKAMLGQCGICTTRGDLSAACRWLDLYLRQYADEREWRHVAKQLLERLRTQPDKGSADLFSLATLLANRLPGDALTGDFLAMVARQMEMLGLSSLAHNYYNRTLLFTTQLNKPAAMGLLPEATPAAVRLGNARCLLDLDRKMEADRLLRDVCGSVLPNKTRSEAALLWAQMALERNQTREGERRLDMIDSRHSDTNVVWQANVNRLLLRVPSATNAMAAVSDVLTAMRDPAALECPELVHKTYQTCLETLTARHDLAGLRMVFASTNAVLSESALEAFRLRIASHYLSRQDYAAAGEWLQQSSLGMSNVLAVISKNNEMLRQYR